MAPECFPYLKLFTETRTYFYGHNRDSTSGSSKNGEGQH